MAEAKEPPQPVVISIGRDAEVHATVGGKPVDHCKLLAQVAPPGQSLPGCPVRHDAMWLIIGTLAGVLAIAAIIAVQMRRPRRS